MLFTHLGDTKRQPDAVKVKYSCPGLFIGLPNKALPISSLTRFKGPELSRQKMFGEHGTYCDEKLVALVCDDQLFVKKTTAGKHFLVNAIETPPYPGAKPHFLIPADRWEDRGWLIQLITISFTELPLPKKKVHRIDDL